MMRHVAMVGLLVAVAGCAQPTPYAAQSHDQGYSETQIDANRWHVTFRGNSVTPKQTVEDYLLYRAAELTAAHGYD